MFKSRSTFSCEALSVWTVWTLPLDNTTIASWNIQGVRPPKISSVIGTLDGVTDGGYTTSLSSIRSLIGDCSTSTNTPVVLGIENRWFWVSNASTFSSNTGSIRYVITLPSNNWTITPWIPFLKILFNIKFHKKLF